MVQKIDLPKQFPSHHSTVGMKKTNKNPQKFLLSKIHLGCGRAINVITSGDFQSREGRSEPDSLISPRENSACHGKSEQDLRPRSLARLVPATL